MAFFPRSILDFFKALVQLRQSIIILTLRDLRTRYLGSFFGLTWALLNPLVSIFIFWFVFDIGFKSAPVDGYPYSLWLTFGIMPWFMFVEAVSGGPNAILESPYLVKKVVFRVSILPIIKILSALTIHIVLLVPVVFFSLAMGHPPGLHLLQLPYYTFCLFFLCLGISWLTSSIAVFVRDMPHFIAVVLQLIFWTAPILWSLSILPERYRAYFEYSPVYYLVEGYRNCFVHNVWFWEQPGQTLVFWGISSAIFFTGAFVFLRLRPHFADVL